MLSFQGIAELASFEWFQQLPFLILVSCGGGILGACFNYLRQKAMLVRSLTLAAILWSFCYWE